jgi:hypothetical protein
MVGSVPLPDSCVAANCVLFDHLVGAGEQCRGNVNAKCLGGFHIDRELELDRLFDT